MNKTTKKNPTSTQSNGWLDAISSFWEKSTSLIQYVLVALFFFTLWAVLAFYESALLERTESLSLFLFDSVYFENMLSVPAGLLSYLGCFLIQWTNQFFIQLLNQIGGSR